MSVQAKKTCRHTGEEVINTLIAEGLMLPINENAYGLTRDQKVEKIAGLVAEMIDTLGYDRSDEELADTPWRVAKMYVDDLYNAWDASLFPKCTNFDNKGTGSFVDEMVIVQDIRVVSNCAHHFIVTDLRADVAYVANKKMIGISKLNKIVKRLARNPTSQETLGKAIARAIQIVTESDDVAVRLDGVHYCVKSRGADDQTSSTITFAALGKFAERGSDLRKEFTGALSR